VLLHAAAEAPSMLLLLLMMMGLRLLLLIRCFCCDAPGFVRAGCFGLSRWGLDRGCVVCETRSIALSSQEKA
jgi:hypothetical protein